MSLSLPQPTAALAVAMMLIAVGNATLMAWLWRFPLVADPASPDSPARSSAPRFWIGVHRGIGYLYVCSFAVLSLLMIPRLWRFDEWSAVSILHAAGGLALGAVLLTKISIIRLRPQLSAALPWLGGSVAALTVAVALSGLVPAILLIGSGQSLSSSADVGRALISERCLQCHGASIIAEEHERPDKWEKELRKMQKRAARTPRRTPISDAEREQIAAFLIETRSERRR